MNWNQRIFNLLDEMDAHVCQIVEKYGKPDEKNQLRMYVEGIKLEGERVDYITVIRQGNAKTAQVSFRYNDRKEYLSIFDIYCVAEFTDDLDTYVSLKFG